MNSYQKQEKLSEGSYSVVHKAIDKRTGDPVALKSLRFEDGEIGIPSNAIREISILKELNHPNILNLREIIDSDCEITIVLEFMEKNLKQLLDITKKSLHPNLIQSYAYQILCGLCYCHCHRIIHRDMKPQNILLDRQGHLKICDFSISRTYTIPLVNYTHEVVTLWYRAPEILLGSQLYSLPIDIWSVGCILAEMILKKPLFPGDSEIGQLYLIFQILGTPNEENFPGINQLPLYSSNFPKYHDVKLKDILKGADPLLIDLISQMLVYDPSKRISAKAALDHPYFNTISQEMKDICRPIEIISSIYYFDSYRYLQNSHDSNNLGIKQAPIVLDENNVIKLSDGYRKIRLGKRKVYHATTYEYAKSIIEYQTLKKVKNGIFGLGIYFASNIQIAKHKANEIGYKVGAFIECKVDFGFSLILDQPNPNLSLDDLKKYDCNSVMGRSAVNKDWEFVVYESERANPIRMFLINDKSYN